MPQPTSTSTTRHPQQRISAQAHSALERLARRERRSKADLMNQLILSAAGDRPSPLCPYCGDVLVEEDGYVWACISNKHVKGMPA